MTSPSSQSSIDSPFSLIPCLTHTVQPCSLRPSPPPSLLFSHSHRPPSCIVALSSTVTSRKWPVTMNDTPLNTRVYNLYPSLLSRPLPHLFLPSLLQLRRGIYVAVKRTLDSNQYIMTVFRLLDSLLFTCNERLVLLGMRNHIQSIKIHNRCARETLYFHVNQQIWQTKQQNQFVEQSRII